MTIKKIRVKELLEFCNSKMYADFVVKPISPLRALSYVNNPRANPDNYVLYMLFNNSNIIAFRTVLPDYINGVMFAWLSGVWVDNTHRGMKLSMSLFDEIFADYNGKLAFTNYTGISEYNLLSTKKFAVVKNRTGKHFYFYPDLKKDFPHHKVLQKLPLLSFAVKTISLFKSLFINASKEFFVEIPGIDSDCKEYLRQIPKTFFERKEKELDWIIKYPWVGADVDKINYPFSYKKDYMLKVVKVFDKGLFVGFFIYTVCNRSLKIVYHFLHGNGKELMFEYISLVAKKYRVSLLTLLDDEMSQMFAKKNRGFCFSKKYTQNVYFSLALMEKGNFDSIVFDGDGDNSFT